MAAWITRLAGLKRNAPRLILAGLAAISLTTGAVLAQGTFACNDVVDTSTGQCVLVSNNFPQTCCSYQSAPGQPWQLQSCTVDRYQYGTLFYHNNRRACSGAGAICGPNRWHCPPP